jgi:predicted RNA-binding protein with PUA-like domain
MAAWLFKTEPTDFSFDDLVKKKTARWDGVRNPTALRNLAAAAVGDVVVLYHTGDEKRAVGLAKVVRAPYPDPALGAGNKFVVLDIAADRALPEPVTLAALRAEPTFADSPLLRIGRLSVVPLTAQQLARLKKLAGL